MRRFAINYIPSHQQYNLSEVRGLLKVPGYVTLRKRSPRPKGLAHCIRDTHCTGVQRKCRYAQHDRPLVFLKKFSDFAQALSKVLTMSYKRSIRYSTRSASRTFTASQILNFCLKAASKPSRVYVGKISSRETSNFCT